MNKTKEYRTVFHSVGELDQLRETAWGASIDISQLQSGNMQGFIANADLGQSSIHLNSFSLAARGRGSVSEDRWSFIVFPIGAIGHFNSLALNSEQMLVYPPGGEFEGTIFGSFKDWVFTVEFNELEEMSRSLSQQDLSCCLSGRFESLRVNPRRLKTLRDFAGSVMSFLAESPDILADDQIRQNLHNELIELLARSILSSQLKIQESSQINSSHSRVVRRTEEFLESNIDTVISVSDLCSVTQVSERTLRNAFLNTVGLSPNKFLKAIRLNKVRIELEQTSPNKNTITAVAMRWGFFHQGHFTRDYKQFFGELPSVTLVR